MLKNICEYELAPHKVPALMRREDCMPRELTEPDVGFELHQFGILHGHYPLQNTSESWRSLMTCSLSARDAPQPQVR